MVDYYAVVNGVFCYKLVPADLNDIPERSTETNWFRNNMHDESKTFWAPVPDPGNNYACLLIDNYIMKHDDITSEGIYEIVYSFNENTVNKISNNW